MSQRITPQITEYTYKQGDIVAYSLSVPEGKLEGTGRIVGVATNPLPILGAIFMVEDPENFPNSVYPYTTIPMQESALEYLYHVEDEYLIITTSYGDEINRFGNNYKAAKEALKSWQEITPKVWCATARIMNHNNVEKELN